MTVRRLGVVIEQLLNDPDSALQRVVSPETAQWRTGDYLLAALYDALVFNTTVQPVNRDGGIKQFPRPADVIEQRAAKAEQEAALEAQRERTRQRRLAKGADDV